MTSDIRQAKSFWIEAGAMSGPPSHRHQIEFSNDLAEFFNDVERNDEIIRVRRPDGEVEPRPLTYRANDYGQWAEIWRLGLLTQKMGGPLYAGQVIKFDRTADADGNVYELTVVAPDSADAEIWRETAQAQGEVSSTGGSSGRSFGFW